MWLRFLPLMSSAFAWLAEQAAAMAIPYAVERLLRRWGADGQVVSRTWDLGSGYDVEGERQERMESNREFLTKLVVDPKYTPTPDGRTYCNMGLTAYAHTFGLTCFDGKLANEICDIAANHPDFRIETDPERVMKHAANGGFAFAGKKAQPHGHVAAVFPGPLVYSGSWKMSVPVLANVGRKNGLMPTSMAFPVKDGPPDFFVFKSGNAEST